MKNKDTFNIKERQTQLEIIDTGIIYRNPLPHVYSKQAYFPSVLQLENGEMLASFTIGQAFESHDLHTELSRSADQGVTWKLQGPLYAGTKGRVTSDTCRLSHGVNGEIIAYVIRHDRSRKDYGLVDPDNLGFVEIEQLIFRSVDGGYHWSKPEIIDPPLVGPSFEMTSAIVPLRNGTWLLPTSTWKGWDGYCPNGMKMVAFVSSNQGRTWRTYLDVMTDEHETHIFWESKMIELDDERLLSAAWVYDQKENKDRDNHYSISIQSEAGVPRQDGSSESIPESIQFSPPRSCGLKGQTLQLFGLADRKVLTVYRRTDQPGLWANISRIEGDAWINEQQIPLWGNQQTGLTSHTGDMAADFSVLKFGAPSICRIQTGFYYISFWAVEEGVSNIRWIKLRIETI
jgi:sialidase-1